MAMCCYDSMPVAMAVDGCLPPAWLPMYVLFGLVTQKVAGLLSVMSMPLDTCKSTRPAHELQHPRLCLQCTIVDKANRHLPIWCASRKHSHLLGGLPIVNSNTQLLLCGAARRAADLCEEATVPLKNVACLNAICNHSNIQ